MSRPETVHPLTPSHIEIRNEVKRPQEVIPQRSEESAIAPLESDALLCYVDDFLDVYPSRPIARNEGGMGLNHSFGLYATLRALNSSFVVESGVWRGQSTWLIQQAAPDATIVCLDPNPGHRIHTAPDAHYFTEDFAGIDWTQFDTSDSLCFFDDHQNALTRMMEMRWWGFNRALFEDNFPVGQGDSYSIRHVEAGAGHPRIQMSPAYELSGRALRRRRAEEATLYEYYWRQAMVRRANIVDRAGLAKNLVTHFETPPLLLNAEHNWGGPWEGAYGLAATPFFAKADDNDRLAAILAGLSDTDASRELTYGYMCFVELDGR